MPSTIDTRYLMRTDDSAEYYFRVAARLETAKNSPHAWVNRTVFVAIAARQQSSVSYDLYAVR